MDFSIKFPVFFFVLLNFPILGTGNPECNEMATSYIHLKPEHQYYVARCYIADVHFDQHTKSNNIKITIESIDGKILETLDLYEGTGYLAYHSTPIYLSHVQSLKSVRRLVKVANYNFNKTTISRYAPNLGYFTFFHDTTKLASMLYIFKNSLDFSLEGNVGDFILRRLPSNTGDGYFQYIYAEVLENNDNRVHPDPWKSVSVTPEAKYNLNTSIFQANPQLFVLLDQQNNFKKSPEEVVKLVLMYFNRIDMWYSNFTYPRIPMTIKGIVIPETNYPNPYIGSMSPNSSKLFYQQASELTEFVHNHKEYFDINNHDIVTLMTERPIYKPSISNPTASRVESLSDFRICENGTTILLLFHVNFQAAHGILMSRLLYSFTSPAFEYFSRNKCKDFPVDLQADNINIPFWPSCIIEEYSKYFKYNGCLFFKKSQY